jgi:hypothetical protein
MRATRSETALPATLLGSESGVVLEQAALPETPPLDLHRSELALEALPSEASTRFGREPSQDFDLARISALLEVEQYSLLHPTEPSAELSAMLAPLYAAYEPEVVRSCARFAGIFSAQDLEPEARRGLLLAVRSYDPQLGSTFGEFLSHFLDNHVNLVVVQQLQLIRLSTDELKTLGAGESLAERRILPDRKNRMGE